MKSSPEQLERIVAYLDGELSAEESAQVEQQLASDEQFRRELQSAQRAWSALDQLPMPHVGDDFSNTTMEMVVDAAQHDLEAKTIALPIQRRKRNTTNILLLAVTVLLAALMVRVIAQNPNRRLLADLPIIQNVDIYSQFESVNFLRDLREYLGEDVTSYTLSAEQLASKLEEHQLISDSDQRQDWLESLDESEKTSLRGKFNRFRELPDSRQQELRTLHQEIAAADEQEQLLPTMYVYQQWLNELEPSEQYELREQPDEQQAEDAATGIKRFLEDRTFELTPEQLRDLFRKAFPHMMRLKRAMDQQLESNPQNMSPEKVRRELMQLLRDNPKEFQRLQELIPQAVPPDVGEAFKQLDERQQLEQVRAWFLQHLHQMERGRRAGSRGRGAARPTEEELQNFFVEELDPAQKERLLALPTDQMQQQLIGLFQGRRARQRWKDRDGSPRWGRPEDRRGPQEGAPRLRGQPPPGERFGPPPNGDRGLGGPGRMLDGPPRGFEGPRGRRPGYFEEEEGPRRRRRAEGPRPEDVPPPREE